MRDCDDRHSSTWSQRRPGQTCRSGCLSSNLEDRSYSDRVSRAVGAPHKTIEHKYTTQQSPASSPRPSSSKMSSIMAKTDTADISYTEQTQVHRRISDADLIGTHLFSRKRLWNREPLDDFYTEALEKYPTEESIDPFEERRVRNKIDWLIIPWYAMTSFISDNGLISV